MSDDADVERLIQNFQNALDVLNNIEDVEDLITKLDADNNRRLLKKVKSVVSDIHGKVNIIKDKVSKAYKRVKTRGNAEIEDLAVTNDRDQNVECFTVRESLESPRQSEGTLGSHIHNKPDNKQFLSERAVEHDKEKHIYQDNVDSEGAEGNDESSNDIIECSPLRTPILKLSLIKSKGNVENEASVIEAVDKEGHNEPSNSEARQNDEIRTDKEDTGTNNEKSGIESEENCTNIGVEGEKCLSEIENEVENGGQDSTEKEAEARNLECNVNETPQKDEQEISSQLDNSEQKIVEKTDKKSIENDNLETAPLKLMTPKIKLVDINKLLAPNSKPMEMTPTPTKSRKSVTFDSSVIVLTSSDEDTPKRNPKETDPTPLKSALRKTSPKVINLSDSDSKENNENLRNTRKSHKNISKGTTLCSDLSSEESDVEDSFFGSRRLRRHERAVKDRFSKLVRERNERRRTRTEKKYFEDDSLDDEPLTSCIKTKRNRVKGSSESEDDSTKANVKKRCKKELLQERSRSYDSDEAQNSDTDSQGFARSRGRNKKSEEVAELDVNDSKLKSKVYVRLLKFNNEELKDLYKKKKDISEVKILPNINLSRHAQPEKDTPENKTIKLTLLLNPKGQENEDSSSDEERSSAEDKEIESSDSAAKERNEMDNVLTNLSMSNDVAKQGANMEDFAVACLEQVKEQSDKDLTQSTDKENAENDEQATKVDNSCEQDKKSKPNGKMSDSDEQDEEKQKHIKQDKSEGGESGPKKTKLRRASTIESSDSDEDMANFSKKKNRDKRNLVKEDKKRVKKKLISDSESDVDDIQKNKNSDSSDDDLKADQKAASDSSESDSGEKSEDTQKKETKPIRRRIKRTKDSSSDDEDKSTRKQIRRMIDRDSLSETTKKAEEEEKDRKSRIAEKQKKYNQIFELKADATVDEVVLDFDEKTKKPLLSVDRKLVRQLKPHQVQGVKFMWDASFESLERTKTTDGSGCILAHCMGLGKTLQVITLSHALLTNQERTKVRKILVVCPVNTVLNWKSEFRKWMPDADEFDIYELVSCKTSSVNHERNYIVKCWHEGGGVLIIGYSMFRTLSNPDNKTISKKLRQSFQTGLVDPGPDLVVCDEGHLLKNEKTNLSIAMNRLKTARRIVLTGTPLQNNLREYWCMVQFIKPNLLGTYKEYMNRFVNPITNGQYTDSTQHDIMVMRRRSHVLHKLLDGVVQRQDYAVLEPYLPPKYEYVVFLKLTDVQIKLYRHYMANFAKKGDGSNRTSFLFTDFQHLQRICTHPRVLLDKSIEDKDKKDKEDETDSEGSLKDFIDDGTDSNSSSSEDDESNSNNSDASIGSNDKKRKKSAPRRARVTRAQAAQKRDNGDVSESEEEEREWWEDYITRDQLDNVNHSAKIFLLFQILKECEEIGDKILVFSQSLYALNCIEYFLARIDEATQKGETDRVGGYSGSWTLGLDYFRLDGSSSCDNRAIWCDHFNDPANTRARLFLISTKAGGLGINLVAANRVIIFDVSWNPSHDIQSIYRVYRFGQTKPSYIYRFVTYGAMEMKIYERQVTKQAISKRVIDEQQIDRHYSQNDIQELYKTHLEPAERPIPMVPKDVLLGELLQKHDQTIYKYHEHQSLLENKQDEELNEDERKAAWEEFENEKVIRKTTVNSFGGIHLGAIQNSSLNFSPQLIQMALGNIVRKDNPTWSDVQIKGILPALVSQLQMQMSENDFSMYNRVQQEIRMMQALQAQRMRENFIKQYQLQQMLQKQHLTNQMLGNLSITPEEIRRLQMAQASRNYVQPAQASGAAGRSNDIIELND